MNINRRDFLKLAMLEMLALQACSSERSSFSINTEEIDLKKIDLKINNLNPNLNNYKIGFLSDIHLGPYVKKNFLIKALNLFKFNKIDLLLLGGDYIYLPEPSIFRSSFYVQREAEYNIFKESYKTLCIKVFNDLGQILKSFSPPDGVIGIYGNHDRWVNLNTCRDSFEKYGLKLLKNKYTEIKRKNALIEIVGVDDYWTGIPTLDSVIPKLNEKSTKILLNHNPDYIPIQSKKYGNNFDLILGGHTHGGQIRLPALGAIVTNTKNKDFVSGLNKIGKSYCYTSRGLGVVEIPYRLNCKPEANIFRLV